jgi:DNA modification methylase
MNEQTPWPADKIERRPIESLIPSARNARTHSPEQVDQLAASIREWGFTVPVLLDEADGIIAGHGRVLAAKKLGLAEIPCMVARGWSAAQIAAYRLADNKLALNAGWDEALLRIELEDLQGMSFDVGLAGFSEAEVAALTADRTAGLTDPDEAPEPPAEPVTLLGDVWLLGRHRLVCGDSTTAKSVAAALNGVEPHLMVTDPPYGVEYDASWRNEAPINRERAPGKREIIGGRAVGVSENDDRADWGEAWALFPGDVAYVWHGVLQGAVVQESLARNGLMARSQIIWVKNQFVISRGDYHFQHETCWYAVRKGKAGHWAGDRKQTSVWQIDKSVKSETGHSAQKPVECMKRPVENNSSPGQAIFDPFVGSGTTIIAAEMTGRACHAIELSPPYVDVSVQRWQNFTGQIAILESTGQSYADIGAMRAQPQ